MNRLPLALLLLLLSGACALVRPVSAVAKPAYAPVSPELYAAIARQDSLLFAAFNRHDLAQLQISFAEDLEFYHDKGGLADFQQSMEGFRHLFEQNHRPEPPADAGTLEVYPIHGYRAVETYQHRFCHVENGKDDCGTFKNMMVWRLKEGRWQVARVVSRALA